MKINVTENKVSIKEEQILNENEYNIHKIQFDFSSEYTDDLVKVALFSIDNHTYKKIISNNECDIPPEVLTQRGYSILGVYAYKTEQDTLVLRYSPSPTKISVYDGSYKADAENSEPITPSEIEQYQQILQNSLQQFQNQYNALVEETEGDIQAIENELQRKVDEGYFDGEDGFSPIAKIIQKSNGATIEIEDKNGKTTADVLNGEDGYTPVRGVDYWTEEDKQEVEEEATQQIEGKIEEYNENAAEKLNQYNQNSVQKTNDYNTNATEKTSTYNSNATEKFNDYNSNAEQKETNYNTNASQKVESFNTNASSKLSEYNLNAETKKTAYDENATQKTNSFNTNATNKLTEYNTNHTEKMSTYNNNSTEKLNAFNENATQKTEDFDEHTEQIQTDIEVLQRTDDEILSNFNKFDEVTGEDITLNETTEIKFAKPPLPMGNSEQVQTTQSANLFDEDYYKTATYETAGSIQYIPLKIKGGRYLVFKTTLKNGGETVSGAYMYLSNIPHSTQGEIIYAISNGNPITRSLDFTATDLYLNIMGNIEDIFNNYNIMIATSDTSYVPFVPDSPSPDYPQEITNVTGDVEVVIGNIENFLDWNKFIDFSNWIVAASPGYMAFKIDGLKVNTKYTLCRVNDDGYNIQPVKYAGFNIGKNNTNRFIDYAVQSSNLKSVTATTNVDGTLYIVFYMSNATQLAQYIELINNCWVIEGESFVEKEEQVFTFPLGNEKLMLGDYLSDDGIHHVRKQIVLDGSENWKIATDYGFGTKYTEESGYIAFSTNINHSFGVKTTTDNGNIFSNIAKVFGWFTLQNTPQIGFCIIRYDNSSTTTLWVAIPRSIASTVSDFITFLQNQNMIIENEIEESVYQSNIVPYTSAQQRVYNEIKNAYSYDEMTIITGSSDGNKPSFTVQAYKDLNKELNNKVDKVAGKELSTNDFTDEYKEQVDTNTEDIEDIQEEQTEQNTNIQKLQTENARLKATLPTTTGTGQDITLDKTAEMEFVKPPLPMGNSDQESTEGRQLLPYPYANTTKTTNGITFTDNGDGSITVNGTSTAVATFFLLGSNSTTNNIPDNMKKTVSIRASGTDNVLIHASVKDENGDTVTNALYGNNETKSADISTAVSGYIRIAIPSGVTINNAIVKPYIVEGAYTTETFPEYERYTNGASPNPEFESPITNVTGDVEVVVENKNLFDKNNTNLINAYFTGGNGIITENSSNRLFYLKCKPNTTYVITKAKTNYFTLGNTSSIPTVGIEVTNRNINGEVGNYDGTRVSQVYTTDSTANYIVCRFYQTSLDNAISLNDVLSSIQVEQNTVATNYVEHKSQTFTFPLGNEKLMLGDYLADDGIHHVRGQVVYDGTEEIFANTSSGDIYAYIVPTSNKKRNANVLSNYFKQILEYNSAVGIYSGAGLNICIKDITTVNDFKTWLSTHNTIVEYELEEEVIVPYTSAQQEVYNQIKQAISYEDQTNIRGSSNGSNPIFSVKAYQNTRLVLEEMATAIVALGGV